MTRDGNRSQESIPKPGFELGSPTVHLVQHVSAQSTGPLVLTMCNNSCCTINLISTKHKLLLNSLYKLRLTPIFNKPNLDHLPWKMGLSIASINLSR